MSSMSEQPTPTISRVCQDGTLVEALYDPASPATRLAIRKPDGSILEAGEFGDGDERLVPYSPRNNLLATGCVLLPSAVGDFEDKEDLVEEIRCFLRRYVELSPTFDEIAPYYVLLTWVYDAFNELAYLRFRGEFGTGKTRALIAVGSLCYKPFFASGASTVSPIFHVLDAFGGTLLLDEADFRFTDATAELTKILNNGTVRGLPVLRTMTNRHRELNPTAFRVFGPKIVAMREAFTDRALESRFITESMGRRPIGAGIPLHRPESLSEEALYLRNRLLGWRFAARNSSAPDPSRSIAGASARLNQVALALLSLVDDAPVRERITSHLLAGDEASAPVVESFDVRLVRAVHQAFALADSPHVPISRVTEEFNSSLESFHIPYSAKAVGAMVRRLGLATSKSRGVYVISQGERAKLTGLALRMGIDVSPMSSITSETIA